MTKTPSHTELKYDPRLVLAVRDLLVSPAGRYFFRWFLAQTGIRQSPFVSGDPYASAQAMGMQNAGLMVEHLLTSANFEQFLAMLREHYDEENA